MRQLFTVLFPSNAMLARQLKMHIFITVDTEIFHVIFILQFFYFQIIGEFLNSQECN